MESELKDETEQILDQLGLTLTEAIRIFFKQVTLHKGLPFDVKVPNELTVKTIRSVLEGRDLKKVGTPEELFKDLGV